MLFLLIAKQINGHFGFILTSCYKVVFNSLWNVIIDINLYCYITCNAKNSVAKQQSKIQEIKIYMHPKNINN